MFPDVLVRVHTYMFLNRCKVSCEPCQTRTWTVCFSFLQKSRSRSWSVQLQLVFHSLVSFMMFVKDNLK